MTVKFPSANPILVLGGLVVAFSGWIAFEALSPSAPSKQQELAPPGRLAGPLPNFAIFKLHIGMPRNVAEHHLATLPVLESEPVSPSADAPAPRSRYLVHLMRPLPHLAPSFAREPFTPGLYAVTFEFDEHQPAQPLVRAEFALLEPARPN